MAEEIKGSPDSQGLGWWSNDRFVVGYIDEVNGPGALEVRDFAPTRHELIQLAKYWARVEIELEFHFFVDQQTGSSEIRRGPFARRRIARIAETLGEEEVRQAVREAHNEFAKGIDARTWNIFVNGTEEEQRALQDEIAREMSGIAQEIAKVTQLMSSLGVDYLVAEGGKAGRFAILPGPAAAVSDPACIILPILHYMNVDADGRYRKNDDGSLLPIQWALRDVGLSPLEMKQIRRLPDPGQAPDDIDLIMVCPDPAAGRQFYRSSNKARWKRNPELALEVGRAAVDASNTLAAKVAGKANVTMLDDFNLFSAPIG